MRELGLLHIRRQLQVVVTPDGHLRLWLSRHRLASQLVLACQILLTNVLVQEVDRRMHLFLGLMVRRELRLLHIVGFGPHLKIVVIGVFAQRLVDFSPVFIGLGVVDVLLVEDGHALFVDCLNGLRHLAFALFVSHRCLLEERQLIVGLSHELTVFIQLLLLVLVPQTAIPGVWSPAVLERDLSSAHQSFVIVLHVGTTRALLELGHEFDVLEGVDLQFAQLVRERVLTYLLTLREFRVDRHVLLDALSEHLQLLKAALVHRITSSVGLFRFLSETRNRLTVVISLNEHGLFIGRAVQSNIKLVIVHLVKHLLVLLAVVGAFVSFLLEIASAVS